jgi:hypothetical protein
LKLSDLNDDWRVFSLVVFTVIGLTVSVKGVDLAIKFWQILDIRDGLSLKMMNIETLTCTTFQPF